MKQEELFPENKLFSHNTLVYWLSGLTIAFVLFALIMLISSVLAPGPSAGSREISEINIKLSQLEDKVIALEKSLENNYKETTRSSAIENPESKNQQNAEIDTSSWQSYESTNYKFIVQYPADWKVEKEAGTTSSKINPEINVSMVNLISPANSRISLYPEGGFEKKINELPESTMKITLSGKTATRNIYKNGLVIIIFDDLNNFRIEFEPFKKPDREIFDALLETLKLKS